MNENKWTIVSNYLWNEENIMKFARHAIKEKGIKKFTSSLSDDGIKIIENEQGEKDFELTQKFALQVYMRNMGYEYIILLEKFIDMYSGVKKKKEEVDIAREYIKVFEAVNKVYENKLDNDTGEVIRWSYEGILLSFAEGFGYNMGYYDTRKEEDIYIERLSTYRYSVEESIRMATEINEDIEIMLKEKNKQKEKLSRGR